MAKITETPPIATPYRAVRSLNSRQARRRFAIGEFAAGNTLPIDECSAIISALKPYSVKGNTHLKITITNLCENRVTTTHKFNGLL